MDSCCSACVWQRCYYYTVIVYKNSLNESYMIAYQRCIFMLFSIENLKKKSYASNISYYRECIMHVCNDVVLLCSKKLI